MENKNIKNSGLWGIISLIMGFGGIFGHYLLNFLFMGPILSHEIAVGQECAVSVPIYFPVFANIGFIGGVLFVIAGIGFLQKTKWAYAFALLGVVVSLKASFWPNIPIMEAGIMAPGPWFGIFLPNLIVYFALLRAGREPWKKIMLGLFGGMAFILNFINAIAATTRLMNHYTPYHVIVAQMFMLVLVINMLASLAFGTFTIGLFLGKKLERARIAGLIGAVLAIIGGFPLAIYSMFFFTIETSFSMFMLAPVISTITMIVPLFPGLWKKFTEPRIVAPKIEA